MNRKRTKTIHVGNVAIGGDNPISIQSMTNTHTQEISATCKQIRSLENVGCEIIRVAVPDQEAAAAIPKILHQIKIPLIADIHFDHKLAIASAEAGVQGLRLNPGNIGSERKVLEVIAALRDKRIPIRIGVNGGSLSKQKLQKYGLTAEALVESALEHVWLLEKNNYHEIKISVKTSNVPLTIAAYELLSQKVDYPLHLGITEAGSEFAGTIKSAIGIGSLLAKGIGDTIRVSLTASPEKEIEVARQILKSLKLRKGLEVISCPTCGRTEIDVIKLTKKVEEELQEFTDENITVAVMGCVVNGPGEAREADYGIAGGRHEGLIFRKGKILKKLPENELIPTLIKLIKDDTLE